MAKTIMLEALAPDVQHALEELFAFQEPVILSRDGQPMGRVEAYSASGIQFQELTPEEKNGLLDDIKQGEADYVAGNYLTLDDLKQKYAVQEGACNA